MGMDVFGKAPRSTTGEYFRRNVWGWRPLWQYVQESHGDIVANVDGDTNSGDGLGDEASVRLGKAILFDVDNGSAHVYVSLREDYLKNLEREQCTICNGTGIRTDAVGVEMKQPERVLDPTQQIVLGREKGWCNGCDGAGDKEPWETNYGLDLDDIIEFAEFLLDCGGFEIC
jgi:hypothetical protein